MRISYSFAATFFAMVALSAMSMLPWTTGVVWAQSKPGASSELRLSTAVAPAFALGKAGAHWAELLNEGAAKAFEVKQYPGAVLTQRDATRELDGLRTGATDLAVGSALAWSAQSRSLAIFGLPWLVVEPRDLRALVADTELRAMLVTALAKEGVVALAFAPLGERVLANLRASPTSPADFPGLRIRTIALPLFIDTLSALGALPQAMSLPDAQRAFVAGTLDGQEGTATAFSATQIASSGLQFVTRWGAFADVMIFAVRQPVWDAWNDSQRALARTTAETAAAQSQAISREDTALNELVAQGVTIVRLSAIQRAAFRVQTQAVRDKWTPLIGADIVRRAEEVLAAPANPANPAKPTN